MAPGFYIDCYGCKRDSSTNKAVLDPYKDDHPFMSTDALAICELDNRWTYLVPTLPRAETGYDKEGRAYPEALFITTPNMGYIPDITKGNMNVQARADGRYGLDDFMVCPQWYFKGTYYLPFVRRKPDNLKTEEYGKIWYDLQWTDFVFEKGAKVSRLGRIRKELADEFVVLRKGLVQKMKSIEADPRFSGIDRAEMLYAKQAIIFASIVLQCAPQTWELTLLTVTGFQRHFLEGLACYEYLTIYRDMDCPDEGQIFPNPSLMGAFTTAYDTAEDLYRHGVPVWLVRVPAHLPLSTTIVTKQWCQPVEGIPSAFLADSQPVYIGHASAVRNRACQALKVGNICLGHGAYTVHPGDFNAQHIAEEAAFRNVYVHPLRSSGTTSASKHSSEVSTGSPSVPSSVSSRETAVPSNAAASTFSSRPSSSTASASRSLSSTSTQGSSAPNPAPLQELPTAAPRHIAFRLDFSPKKFVPLESDRLHLNQAWVRALKSVAPVWTRVLDHNNLQKFRGYAFLDPYLIAKEKDKGFFIKTLVLGWLLFRPLWFARLAESSRLYPAYPNPQEWRAFLGIDLAIAMGWSERSKDSSEQESKRQKRDVRLKEECGLEWSALQREDIWWRKDILFEFGKDDVKTVTWPYSLQEEITWDLLEHNFRFELFSLDRSIFPRERMSLAGGVSRDERVVACFPNEAFCSMDYPRHDEGLGALLWEDRMEYVEAFRVLLCDWPGSQAETLKGMKSMERSSTASITGNEADVVAIERVAYPFYCQMYYDYFGRAPSVPYQRPV